MNNYSKIVQKRINDFPVNVLLIAGQLYNSIGTDVPEATFYKILERMCRRGELMHLTKGVYYRPKKTKFGVIPLSEDSIVKHYTGNKAGIIIGYRLYNKKGITTQVSKRTEILSNALKEQKKNIRDVSVERIDFRLDEETIPVVETLEMLQNYKSIEDINKGEFIRHMESFASIYSDKVAEYVLENRKYKKSTIAFLSEFLKHMNVPNSLDKHLSELSDYKIPKMEELYETSPLS